MDAYNFVQERRGEAEKLWKRGDPKGLAVLKDTLAYLQQPLVLDLADGNPYLVARKVNIDLDFAGAYAIQGNDKLFQNLSLCSRDRRHFPPPKTFWLLGKKWARKDHRRTERRIQRIRPLARGFEAWRNLGFSDSAHRRDYPSLLKVVRI